MIQLQLENTSTCNAKCGFCIYPTAERWGGLMSFSLFQKIIDEAANIDAISQICITGLGEPLLDPLLKKRIQYTRERKPTAHIEIYTNGVYLTASKFRELEEAGLSSAVVSLNAVRADQHERIMGLKGKFSQICAQLQEIDDLRPKTCSLEVRAVVNGDDFTDEDVFHFYRAWGLAGRGGIGLLIREGNWAGDNRTVRVVDTRLACHRALRQIYVMYDGRVATCCFDATGKQVFGDLNQQSLREVYEDPTYLKFRLAHFEDRADQYELCANCTRI